MDDIKAGDYIFITAPHLLEIDNQVLIDNYRININDEYEVTRVVGDIIFLIMMIMMKFLFIIIIQRYL